MWTFHIPEIVIRDFHMVLSVNFSSLKSLRSNKVLLLQKRFELCELWCISFIQCAICSAFHLLNPGLVSAFCFWKTSAKPNQTAIRSLYCRSDLWPSKPLPRPLVNPSPQPILCSTPSWKWYYGVWIILLVFLHTVILFALSCVGAHRWCVCVYACVCVCVYVRACVRVCEGGMTPSSLTAVWTSSLAPLSLPHIPERVVLHKHKPAHKHPITQRGVEIYMSVIFWVASPWEF